MGSQQDRRSGHQPDLDEAIEEMKRSVAGLLKPGPRLDEVVRRVVIRRRRQQIEEAGRRTA
jgi:hypothetical protein